MSHTNLMSVMFIAFHGLVFVWYNYFRHNQVHKIVAVIDMTNIADNIHCLGLSISQIVGWICLRLQVEKGGGGSSTYYGGTVRKSWADDGQCPEYQSQFLQYIVVKILRGRRNLTRKTFIGLLHTGVRISICVCVKQSCYQCRLRTFKTVFRFCVVWSLDVSMHIGLNVVSVMFDDCN
jgi:hypothetical protein